MLCLTLTHPTISQWSETLHRYAGQYNCVELRIDLLEFIDTVEVVELARAISQPTILTARRTDDGGGWERGDETRRFEVLTDLLTEGDFSYVDLELDLRESPEGAALEDVAANAGSHIIRSLHDFDGMPEDILATLDGLARSSGEIPKLAVTPSGTRDVVDLFRAYRMARDRYDAGFILLGMGRFGVPTRILCGSYGALLTFASESGAEAAPGHMDPAVLQTVYGFSEIGAETRVFGVVGKPVLHSKPTHYHHPLFRRDELNAVYVPFPTDDVDAFFRLVDELPVEGFSVTIPHKEAVLKRLVATGAITDDGSKAAGSCNTVVRRGDGFVGVNTDVPGFLRPLQRVFGEEGLDGRRATVLGAGGAARAVCYALAASGVSTLVLNRTVSRAERLARDVAQMLPNGPWCGFGPLTDEGFALACEFDDIIVQTTGIGMAPHVDGDPAPGLRFSGSEVVYDIIYTPERTTFLQRAQAAGCRTITGRAMFDGQAAEQYELFRRRLSE